jgi:hypothetical protein
MMLDDQKEMYRIAGGIDGRTFMKLKFRYTKKNLATTYQQCAGRNFWRNFTFNAYRRIFKPVRNRQRQVSTIVKALKGFKDSGARLRSYTIRIFFVFAKIVEKVSDFGVSETALMQHQCCRRQCLVVISTVSNNICAALVLTKTSPTPARHGQWL